MIILNHSAGKNSKMLFWGSLIERCDIWYIAFTLPSSYPIARGAINGEVAVAVITAADGPSAETHGENC